MLCVAYCVDNETMYLERVPWSVCQSHSPAGLDQRQYERRNLSTTLKLYSLDHCENNFVLIHKYIKILLDIMYKVMRHM